MKAIKLFCVATLMLFTSMAYAEPAEVLIIDEYLAFCVDGNSEGALFHTRVHRVQTNSDTGEIVYSLQGTCGGAPVEGRAMHWDNANTGAICTDDAPYFQMVVTKSRNASMKCQNWPFED